MANIHEALRVKSFYPVIETVHEAFEIALLDTTRKIRILLPCDYYLKNQRYPVLYLHDGQNLFDENAPYGNWAIDKKLEDMARAGNAGIIVVAIDHGDESRLKEYNPFPISRVGKGHGRRYARFLAESLKPHIDQYYRTLPDREYTGIGGSSMGGLISIWCGLRRPRIYSKFMIFSPSLWISPLIYYHAMTFFPPDDTSFYIYSGEKESKSMVPQVEKFARIIEKRRRRRANVNVTISLNPEREHNEWYWSNEFANAIEWLYTKSLLLR